MVKVSKFFSNGYVLSLFLFLSCILMNTFLQAGNYLVIREGVRIRGAIQVKLNFFYLFIIKYMNLFGANPSMCTYFTLIIKKCENQYTQNKEISPANF